MGKYFILFQFPKEFFPAIDAFHPVLYEKNYHLTSFSSLTTLTTLKTFWTHFKENLNKFWRELNFTIHRNIENISSEHFSVDFLSIFFPFYSFLFWRFWPSQCFLFCFLQISSKFLSVEDKNSFICLLPHWFTGKMREEDNQQMKSNEYVTLFEWTNFSIVQ